MTHATDDARDVLSTIADQVGGVVDRTVEATQGDVIAGAPAAVEDVREVVEELLEFVEAVDLTEGASALEVPDSTSPMDAVDVTELNEEVDIRDLWREFRELKAEVEDLYEHDGSSSGHDVDEADDVDPAELELAVQSAVSDAVERFREEILAARERLTAAIDDLDDREVDDPDSRNPSAFSTLPSSRGDVGNAARGSTVPRETRYSTTPNYRRIYGDRFETAEVDDE